MHFLLPNRCVFRVAFCRLLLRIINALRRQAKGLPDCENAAHQLSPCSIARPDRSARAMPLSPNAASGSETAEGGASHQARALRNYRPTEPAVLVASRSDVVGHRTAAEEAAKKVDEDYQLRPRSRRQS
jgi:hypothetical protein